MDSVKKPTGDPSFPESVRRAKRIARSILVNATLSRSVCDSSSSEVEKNYDSFGYHVSKESSPDEFITPYSADISGRSARTSGLIKIKRARA